MAMANDESVVVVGHHRFKAGFLAAKLDADGDLLWEWEVIDRVGLHVRHVCHAEYTQNSSMLPPSKQYASALDSMCTVLATFPKHVVSAFRHFGP